MKTTFAKVVLKNFRSALALYTLLFLSQTAFGQGAFNSTGIGGNWNNAGSWTLTGGADGDGIPDANDNVTILGNDIITVNVNSACTSLQIGATPATGVNPGTLNFSGAFSLTVSGAVTVGGFGNVARRGTVTFSVGSAIVAGSLTFGNAGIPAGTPNLIDMTAGGTLTTGSLAVNAGPVNTWTPGAGTVELTATNTLPATIFTSFNNLTINGGTTTLGVGISIGGTLSVDAGLPVQGER